MDEVAYGTNQRGECYAFEWIRGNGNRRTRNAYGITDWCTIIARRGGAVLGSAIKVHMCAKNPCTDVWPANRWGDQVAPVHYQPTAWRPGAAAPAVVHAPYAVADAPSEPALAAPVSVPLPTPPLPPPSPPRSPPVSAAANAPATLPPRAPSAAPIYESSPRLDPELEEELFGGVLPQEFALETALAVAPLEPIPHETAAAVAPPEPIHKRQ